MLVYYTVVYKVDGDNTAHDAWWQTISPLFMKDSVPVSVTAISKADEITRLGCISHVMNYATEDYGAVEKIDNILTHPDPLAWWRENVEERQS